MAEKFNRNHLFQLEQKKEELDSKIHEEEKKRVPDDHVLRELKIERLHLKEEISQYMKKH